MFVPPFQRKLIVFYNNGKTSVVVPMAGDRFQAYGPERWVAQGRMEMVRLINMTAKTCGGLKRYWPDPKEEDQDPIRSKVHQLIKLSMRKS